MYNCWLKNPKDRPNFTNIKNNLDILMENSTQYLLLDDEINKFCGDTIVSGKSSKEYCQSNVERYVSA